MSYAGSNGTSVFVGLLLVLAGCASAPPSEGDGSRRTAELEQENNLLGEENALLREEVETLTRRLDILIEKTGVFVTKCPLGLPSIDAFILDVNRDLSLVVLDKGKRDGVKLGYTFSVYRDAQFKGQVRITDVREASSVGTILSEKQPIAPGDRASTGL